MSFLQAQRAEPKFVQPAAESEKFDRQQAGAAAEALHYETEGVAGEARRRRETRSAQRAPPGPHLQNLYT